MYVHTACLLVRIMKTVTIQGGAVLLVAILAPGSARHARRNMLARVRHAGWVMDIAYTILGAEG
jgi:hypothetical protein